MRTSFRNQRKRLSKTRRFRSRLSNRARRPLGDLIKSIDELAGTVAKTPSASVAKVEDAKAEVAALAAEVVAAGVPLPAEVKAELRDAGIVVPTAAAITPTEAASMTPVEAAALTPSDVASLTPLTASLISPAAAAAITPSAAAAITPVAAEALCTLSDKLDDKNTKCYDSNKVGFKGKDGKMYAYDKLTGKSERVVREKQIVVGEKKFMLDEDTGELREVKVELAKVETKLPDGRIVVYDPNTGKTEIKKKELPKVETELPDGRIMVFDPNTGKTEIKKKELPKVETELPDGRIVVYDPNTGKTEIKKKELPKVETELPDGRIMVFDPNTEKTEIKKKEVAPAPKQVLTTADGRAFIMDGDRIQFLDEMVLQADAPQANSPRRSRRSVSPVRVVVAPSVGSLKVLPDKCNVRNKKSCKKSSGCKWNKKNGCMHL